MHELAKGNKIPIALTPCLKAECDQWRGGECIQIRKAGKPDKPQVSVESKKEKRVQARIIKQND